jgi:hypothetical protein
MIMACHHELLFGLSSIHTKMEGGREVNKRSPAKLILVRWCHGIPTIFVKCWLAFVALRSAPGHSCSHTSVVPCRRYFIAFVASGLMALATHPRRHRDTKTTSQ